MRIDTRLLGFGLFLVLAGAIPVAVREGYLPAESVDQLWRVWPLLLIGIGLGIILGRTAFGWLGGLIVAATFGLLVGAALSGGVDRVACGFGPDDREIGGTPTSRGGSLADGATVRLDFDCGPLKVGVAPGSEWSLTYWEDPGVAPRVQDSAERLRVESPSAKFLGEVSRWDLTLPATPSLSVAVHANAGSAEVDLSAARLTTVEVDVNAGSFDLDLSGATVGRLSVSVNAGSGALTLPAATFSGTISVNAGSLSLCAPAETGLRIVTSGALSSTDFAGSGLVLSGSTWESPDYATAATRIDLEISANAASVSLTRDGGCS